MTATIGHGHRNTTIFEYGVVTDEVKEYIRDNIEIDNLVMLDFCTANSYSRRHVQRALAWNSTSWRKELTRIRMKAGAEMLRTTSEPVRVIARKVGYRQPAQFAKAFRRECGVTPAQYRNDHRG